MSLVPLLFSDWWEDLDRPHRLLDQNFGLGLSPNQLIDPATLLDYTPALLPARERNRQLSPMLYLMQRANDAIKRNAGSSTVTADKDKFQVILDVQQFKPEEINVKVVDKYVIVEAKHEDKQDEHGWVSRQFVRKYLIPEQCDLTQVSSNLSSDGVLSITAPRKDVPKLKNERPVKIEQTGRPALQDKQPAKEINDVEMKEK